VSGRVTSRAVRQSVAKGLLYVCRYTRKEKAATQNATCCSKDELATGMWEARTREETKF
jgi:hypothetical protein